MNTEKWPATSLLNLWFPRLPPRVKKESVGVIHLMMEHNYTKPTTTHEQYLERERNRNLMRSIGLK